MYNTKTLQRDTIMATFQYTPRMLQILEAVDPLDDEYENLHAVVPGFPYENPTRDKMREVRKQISTLMVEYWNISMEINKEWHAQPPLWQKKGL